MDDKKKSVAEETKEVATQNDDVVEFDDVRNALDKIETKKASLGQKSEKPATKEEVKQVFGIVVNDDELENEIKKESEKKEELDDKKEPSKK